MDSAITVKGLVKRFGSFTALDGMDLDVQTGQVHGFLGPNGSGKSTTIRVILGLLRADAGTVTLLGGDPWRDVVPLHRRLAYVPGDVSLWPSLTGGEAIDLLGKLRGGLDESRRAHLLERFELDPTKKGRTYSKGNRQKVAIVAALSSDVELLVLDEPTSGLDPLMEAVFQEEIALEKARGRTVLLSSHILSEVEALADRVSIIRDGVLVETGTLDQVRRHRRSHLRVELTRVPDRLGDVDGIHELAVQGTTVTCTVDDAHTADVMSMFASGGIVSITSTPASLEDIFLSHYDDRLNGTSSP